MGKKLTKAEFNKGLSKLNQRFDIYAPKRFSHRGTFSDTDLIRYDKVVSLDEMIFDEKSVFSPKEAFFPPTETMYYFTDTAYTEPDIEKKERLLFLRACDLHGVKRLDEIYLKNVFTDPYYERQRKKIKFAVVGCSEGFDSCFCASMRSNTAEPGTYAMGINFKGETIELELQDDEIAPAFSGIGAEASFTLDTVSNDKQPVTVPDEVPLEQIAGDPLWEEYDTRCIACGKCNFVCPTCSCTTTQDIFYTENGRAGERRRVWASCEVDDFSSMAGGHDFRKKKGERMRFKVMHKISDFKRRFGFNMCVGCGRCDDACPEYISFANCIGKVADAVKGGQK